MSEPVTPDQLTAWAALADRTPPGPWTLEDWTEDDGPNKTTLTAWRAPETELEAHLVSQVSPGRWPIAITEPGCEIDPTIAAFIAASRAAVPALCAALQAAREQLAECEAHNEALIADATRFKAERDAAQAARDAFEAKALQVTIMAARVAALEEQTRENAAILQQWRDSQAP